MFRGRSSSSATAPGKARPQEKTLDPNDPSIAEAAKQKKVVFDSVGFTEYPKALMGDALQEISLNFNKLVTIPEEVLALANLKKLSVENNYISVIPEKAIANSGKKLSAVELSGNPLAFPPMVIAQKGWSTVKKWAPANPSYVVYRLYHKEHDGMVSYTDINYGAVRDTMVKTKDEDRDSTYCKIIGVDEVLRLATIERHKMNPKSGAVQTNPGWCSAPNERGVHVYPVEYFYTAVFDGHAGAWVAQALTTNLHKKLAEAGVFATNQPTDYDVVIKKVFMDLDKIICDKLRENKSNDGSTAVTVTLKATGEMIAAHVGDSRASGKFGKDMVEFTHDHDPGQSKEEKARVEARGGKVDFQKGCWRINGNLSVSRAFGDTNMKEDAVPIVDAEPDVAVRPFSDVEWLIVASDGLWHLIDNKDVVKLASGKTTAEEASLALFSTIDGNTRSQLKGHDNTTIICLRLTHGTIPAEFRLKGPL